MSPFATVGSFIFGLIFSLIIFLLWARIALRYLKISSLHPVSQVIHNLTNPVILPFERLLFAARPQSRYDWAAIALLIPVEFVKFVLLALFFYGVIIPVFWLITLVLADLILQPLDFLFYAILIRVILSWVNPQWQHPVADVLRSLTEPLLRRGRKLVPDI